MNPLDQNFKGQLSGENSVCVFRRHWISVFNTLLSLPGILIVQFILFINLPALVEETKDFGLLLAFVFLALHALIHRQFLAIFHYYLETVIVTDRRVVIVDKSVFLKDSKSSIDLLAIQDVEKRQDGFFESFFDYGSLVFMLSGSSESTVINMVPRPEYQYKKIHQVKSSLSGISSVHAKMAG